MLVALMLTAACAGEPEAESVQAPIELGPDAVRVLDSGHYRTILACSAGCVWRESFWVDLAVRDDAYDKEVAIVWSADGWASVSTAYASFEGHLEGEFEAWGVDVVLGIFGSAVGAAPSPKEVVYAAYVRMAGQTHWEPYNDHYIYGRVDAQRPVRLLSSAVDYDGGVVLSGRARVFDLAYDKRVTVRYTTDDWATSGEIEAQFDHGDDWAFRARITEAGVVPAEVQYAVRYHVAGQTYWDSDGGANHRKILAPQWSLSSVDLDEPVSGILRLGAGVRTDLPVTEQRARLDGGAWQDTFVLAFSTAGLTEGAHEAEFGVTLGGGYRTTEVTPFTVHNDFLPVEVWEPPLPSVAAGGGRGASWGLAVAGDGAIYLQWEAPGHPVDGAYHGIARYDGVSDEAAALYEAFPRRDSGYPVQIWELTVDDEGRVYGLEPGSADGLWRWNADGSLDTAFGDGGRLDLARTFDGHRFDTARTVAWGGDALWVVGWCWSFSDCTGNSINKFGEDGAYLGHAILPDDLPNDSGFSTDPGALHDDGDGLWVLQGRTLLRVAHDLSLVDTIELAGGEQVRPEGLTRLADGTFVALDGSDRIVALDGDGARVGHWYLNDVARSGLAGGTGLAKRVTLLPDGTIGVLDVEDARIQRFVLR